MLERRKRLGSSDMKNLFEVDGCRKMLLFDKLGIRPDFPFITNYHIERGEALESFVFKKLKKKYKKQIDKVKPVISEKYDIMRANADGLFPFFLSENEGLNYGGRRHAPVEIKNPMREVFVDIRSNGAKKEHILQLHHSMICWDAPLGIYAFFNADLWSMEDFPIYYNESLGNIIIDKCLEFGKDIEAYRKKEKPLTLEDSKGRDHKFLPEETSSVSTDICKKCQWRKKCWNDVYAMLQAKPEKNSKTIIDNIPELEGLLKERTGLKRERSVIDNRIADIDNEIKEKYMRNNVKVSAYGRSIFWGKRDSVDYNKIIKDYGIDTTGYIKEGVPYMNIRDPRESK